MNHTRENHGCGIYHSSVHSGRPVIVTAGSYTDGVAKSSEIWDFTVPGSQWQSSKYLVKKTERLSVSNAAKCMTNLTIL